MKIDDHDLMNILETVTLRDGSKRKLKCDSDQLNSLKTIQSVPELTQLFDAVATEEDIRKFLWRHRHDYMPFKGVVLPIFYDESMPFRDHDPLAYEASKSDAELRVHVYDALNRFLPILPDILAGFEEQFQETTAKLPSLETEREEEIRTEIVTREVTNRIIQMYSEDGLRKVVNTITSRAGDLVVPALASIFSIWKYGALQFGRKHLENLLVSSRQSYEEYHRTLKQLADRFCLLSPATSLVWCTQCRKHPQSYFAVASQDPPVSTCPVCKSEMAVGTFYYPKSPLAKLLDARDGLLGTTVHWSLRESGRSWAPGVYVEGLADDTEKDAVFQMEDENEIGIVESKVHHLDSPGRTLESQIREDLNQLSNHWRTYDKADIHVSSAYLVTNIPQCVGASVVDNILSLKEFSEIPCDIEVFYPETFEDFRDIISEE
ncbi:MAG: hypothetical protein KKE24_00875 [Candidatus Thermoplasmatota archaeon]|nr:hypothetical protein [Candidatus Thermoplasmatota archaeon]